MKIVQFGLCYSPNVGDGIIAECLAHAIRHKRPGAEVVAIDLSGRQGFGAVTIRNRSLALAVLSRMPSGPRRWLVEKMMCRVLDRVEPAWTAAVAEASLAIVGGGQIFSDADLNFCVKIARAARIIAAAGVPSVVYAVGVSRNWSPRGRALFLELGETDLRFVGVRDPHSAAAWTAQVPEDVLPAPEITLDPGLLAATCYGPPPTRNGRIGLCVTAPDILAYHADRAVAGAGAGRFFADLALDLVGRGHRVALFCNGAAEDRAALKALRKPLAEAIATGAIEIVTPPETPTELAWLVSAFAAVVAHRLHACIVAYSYGLPVVGLGWDRKVESFFETIEVPDRFIGVEDCVPAAVADRVEAAITAGIDGAVHAWVMETTWEGVEQALQSAGLSQADQAPSPESSRE